MCVDCCEGWSVEASETCFSPNRYNALPSLERVAFVIRKKKKKNRVG